VKESVLLEKSLVFVLRIVKLSRYLQKKHKEYILSKQIVRSGTAIGALIKETQYTQPKADFLRKHTITLKH